MIRLEVGGIKKTVIQANERLIVALDLPTVSEAARMIERLEGQVSFFKIGLELQFEAGRPFIEKLLEQGHRVFLDLKFFDVEETVRRAVAQVARIGAHFLTVHGNKGILKAAIEGRGSAPLKILAVTVLTQMDAADLMDMGLPCSVSLLALHRARMACAVGCDGVVASGKEVSEIKAESGDRLVCVVPGIRPEGNSEDDHKRSVTPAMAISAGADYLVVGRPIRDAVDPAKAAEAILAEMQKAFNARL